MNPMSERSEILAEIEKIIAEDDLSALKNVMFYCSRLSLEGLRAYTKRLKDAHRHLSKSEKEQETTYLRGRRIT